MASDANIDTDKKLQLIEHLSNLAAELHAQSLVLLEQVKQLAVMVNPNPEPVVTKQAVYGDTVAAHTAIEGSTRSTPSCLTTDPLDPRLNKNQQGQNEVYLVLSDAELAKGFVRPMRNVYKHLKCGTTTTMGQKLSETYARNPKFYGATFCAQCYTHLPVDEFFWYGTNEKVGS